MASWPKGLSRKAQTALEDAGYTPEATVDVSPDDLIAALGISKAAAEIVTRKSPPQEIETIRKITGRYPPKVIWSVLVEQTAGMPEEALMKGWQDHVMGGGNQTNYAAWLAKAQVYVRPPIQVVHPGIKPMPDMSEVIDAAEAMSQALNTPWQIAMQTALNIKANGL